MFVLIIRPAFATSGLFPELPIFSQQVTVLARCHSSMQGLPALSPLLAQIPPKRGYIAA